MSKLLTVIVTYNGMKWIEDCLSSVKGSDMPSDIFIVDNGSTDETVEYIKSHYPEAILIESEENLGFGKANNLGLKYAVENGYDYVYLLNQDAWVEKDTFSKMIAVTQKNPEYGILSPLQVNKEKTKLDKNFSWYIPSELSSDLLCSQPLEEVYKTNFIMAAHWLLPVEALKKVGIFSPAFYHYGEDDNLVHRMTWKGYKTGIVPSTRGVHDRENRPFTKEAARYRDYVSTIVMLNNPTLRHPLLSLIGKSTKKLFHPGSTEFKYLIYPFRDYMKSRKYRKEYKKEGSFLN